MIKGQLTPSFNLPSVRSTMPLHYVGTSFRTESCFLFKINYIKLPQNHTVTLGKTKVNALRLWINAALSSTLTLVISQRRHQI